MSVYWRPAFESRIEYQATAMIVMTVADSYSVQIVQAYSHPLCVLQESIRSAGIK